MPLACYYSYNWVESIHVMSLMLCLDSLFTIDLRMIGLALTDVPASIVAARLHKPMIIGFVIMFVTGSLLFYAKPVETTQSLWFRIKMLLMLVAAINAWIFNHRMQQSVHSWNTDRMAPKPMRTGAMLSLGLWCGVILMGRYIPYDWVDCDKVESAVLLWTAGCVNELQAL